MKLTRLPRNDLPPSLDPLVTTHPASCAYRITDTDCAAHTWTHAQSTAMAAAVVHLDMERQIYLTPDNGGTAQWADRAGRQW